MCESWLNPEKCEVKSYVIVKEKKKTLKKFFKIKRKKKLRKAPEIKN